MKKKSKNVLLMTCLLTGALFAGDALVGHWTSFTLDGQDDFVQAENADYGEDFSLSFWFNAEEPGTLFSHGSAEDGDELSMSLAQDGTLSLELGETALSASTQLGVLTHCALVVSGSEVTLYVNGESVAVSDAFSAGGFDPEGKVVFGADSGKQSGFLKGRIENVQILDRALSDAEVSAEYFGLTSLDTKMKGRLSASGNVRPPVPDLSSSTGGGCLLKRHK